MKEYNYTEIGMLTGTALGGALTVVLFSVLGINNPVFLLLVAAGTAAGIWTGKMLDRKNAKKNCSAKRCDTEKDIRL